MTIASATIKKTAKDSIKSNFINVIIVTSIILFCYLINNNIASMFYLIGGDLFANALFYLMNLFILIPVFFGGLRYFWRLLCGVTDNPLSVFNYFSSKENYKKVLKLTFYIIFKTLLTAILLLIPYIVVTVISNIEIYKFLDMPIPLWTTNLSNVTAFLGFIALIGTLFLMLKYYLAPMLIIADENMDVNEAIHMSVVISKNTTLDFVYLAFSMIGWILLSLLFIPLLYTLPLFMMVYLTHCSFAVNEYNERTNKINNENSQSFMAGI